MRKRPMRISPSRQRGRLPALGGLASLVCLTLTVALVPWSALALTSGDAGSSGSGHAFHYDIERFAITGPGSTHLANEEFNDGDPLQFGADPLPVGGSVTGRDGALHLTTEDGFDDTTYSLVAPGLEVRRARAVSNTTDFAIFDGQGDFTMESEWRSGPDDVNASISMGLSWSLDSGETHTLSITLRDYAPENLSAPFTGGDGLAISIERSVSGTPVAGAGPPPLTSFEQLSTALSPGSVTGSVVLQLVFDDATNTFTALTSTDGGASFIVLLDNFSYDASLIFGENGASPFFEAHEIVSIGDDSLPIPEPSAALMIALGLAVLNRRRR